ncbi:hypothetical protein [Acaryochloris sp. CCMEE 5410]|uniref:hypothetical protein n=1 Tax=Acaryochloris sp. CCMEE 5410 TaxID=310037 RepID=UPI0002484C3D|nr:hypothetical protein [Acaryochloris sp. CCMEE 5410]
MNPTGKGSNNVDELRYLFLASQVKLLDTPKNLEELKYQSQSENRGVVGVKADGEKCDRCEPIIENLVTQGQISLTQEGRYQSNTK